jgi:membrane-bound lytic murein transglycosylase A
VRGLITIVAALTLSACAGVVPQSGGPQRPTAAPDPVAAPAPSAVPIRTNTGSAARPTPATPGTPLTAGTPAGNGATGATAGVVAGPPISSLPIDEAMAARALISFRASCPSVMRRQDLSGLAQPADWTAACAAAARVPNGGARAFFADHFRTVQIGDGRGFATGYYEPEIAASRTRRPGYEVPIYGRPSDLVEINLGTFNSSLAGRTIRGRIQGNQFVPYHSRAEIVDGVLSGRAPIIAYAADAIDFFVLQIQGSGRLRLPDGSIMRIGYASQNGREYVGVGRLLRDRGVLQPGEASMQGIVAYMRRQPDGGASVMNENPSWVFFVEQTGPGPLGTLNVPVIARASVAADPAFIPLGAPVWLAMDRAEATGLWIAQDTGGAIRGANRVDTFWGAGEQAEAIAGGMSSRGAALLLLPTASVERLLARR